MSTPLLTVAVPTYNGEKTIRQMLDILLPQCDERVEVLVSDNASTDTTAAILAEYVAQYPQIRLVRNEQNIGPDANFLQCMRLASGKYTLLLSDDDVLMENKLARVLDFLENSPKLSLVYLNAKAFFDVYTNESDCRFCDNALYDGKIFSTADKKLYMDYAKRMWGFLSCFICLTEAFQSIAEPEQYFGTNWLQSYIHILCADYGDKQLGVFGEPCIGAGVYAIINNFDAARVDGVEYRKMLDFAIAHGFDKPQLDAFFQWRFCFLLRRTIIKERAAGIHRSDFKAAARLIWRYPYAWIMLYPFFLIPPFACRWIMQWNNKRKGRTEMPTLNRQGDVSK